MSKGAGAAANAEEADRHNTMSASLNETGRDTVMNDPSLSWMGLAV
jgi:hypothetical protein